MTFFLIKEADKILSGTVKKRFTVISVPFGIALTIRFKDIKMNCGIYLVNIELMSS